MASDETRPDEDVRDLLLQITRDMVAAEDLDALLQTIVDAALRIIPPASKCVIHLLDTRRALLRPRFCSRPSAIDPESAGIPAHVGIAGKALAERRTIRVSDAARDPDFAPLNSGIDLRSLLVAPLYVNDVPLGTLSLSSASVGAFGVPESRYAQTLAAQAAVSLQHASMLMEARGQRERSDAIIASMSDGLMILDGSGQITRTNAALIRMLELPAEDAWSSDSGSQPPQLLDLLYDPRAKVMGRYETELDLPSGNKLTLQVTPSELGIEEGTVLVIRDIVLERTQADARALFISQVSHELRTPLQHVLSFASLISDSDDLTRTEELRFLEHIEEEVHNMGRLVDDLVELSRIETGRFAIYAEVVRLDRLVADVVNRLEPQASLKNLTLSLSNAAVAIWIFTDPVRVEQVLVNLVTNACKFAPDGGSIEVCIEESPDQATIHVADDGPGIASEAIEGVFDPFSRGPSSVNVPGMGLGLYISRQIVEALGGTIWVKSQPGEGSVFSFRLPKAEYLGKLATRG